MARQGQEQNAWVWARQLYFRAQAGRKVKGKGRRQSMSRGKEGARQGLRHNAGAEAENRDREIRQG